MAFRRRKEIPPGSGRWYEYEQESKREGGKVRSRHVRYLGFASHAVRGGGVGTTRRAPTRHGVPVLGKRQGPYGAQEVDLNSIPAGEAQSRLEAAGAAYVVKGEAGGKGHIYIVDKLPPRLMIDPVTGKEISGHHWLTGKPKYD